MNCELVELSKLVTSFRIADNRKSAQKGQKSEKIFAVVLMSAAGVCILASIFSKPVPVL